MPKGTVSQFDEDNRCGFIEQDDGEGIFFYDVEVATPGLVLKEGDKVVYGIALEYQGKIAVNIHLV